MGDVGRGRLHGYTNARCRRQWGQPAPVGISDVVQTAVRERVVQRPSTARRRNDHARSSGENVEGILSCPLED